MNLKRSSCSYSEELPSKVAVLLVTVIQSEDSDKKIWFCCIDNDKWNNNSNGEEINKNQKIK